MRLKIIFLILILIPNNCFALTEYQEYIIDKCYSISKRFGYENSIPGMCGTESSFGINKIGDNGTSFGVLQIKLSTAQDVLQKNNVELNPNLLKFLLTEYDEFNIIISCLYLKFLDRICDSHEESILSYNVGLTNVIKYGLSYDPNNYLNKVKKMNEYLRKKGKFIEN